MPVAYIPVIFFALATVAVPVALLVYFHLRQPGARESETEIQPAESVATFGPAVGGPLAVHFYFVATLFVVFAVATVLLFAWAISFRVWLAGHRVAFAMSSMMVFVGIVAVAYGWMYKTGVLDWE
jgi:NADH-quinone oxidoreductase subunit A